MRLPGRPHLRELLLGARLTISGGREAWARTALTAAGVGLGVALLLAAASLPHAQQARDDRGAARATVDFVDDEPPSGPGTLLVATADTRFRDDDIRGRLLRPEGPDAPLPPGVARFPRPGEMVVSPALARLLRASGGALLRERLPARISGAIAPAGLTGPSELAYYAGDGGLTAEVPEVVRVTRFGVEGARTPLDPVLYLLVVIVVVVLLTPIAVFIATAVRFGGESRDRRLAALRLVGADRGMARRIAAGEALVGALAGLAAGVALFLAGRPFAERLDLWGISLYASDLRPSLALATLIVLAVPTAAVLVTLLALRRIVIEPLGVVRRSAGRRRRVAWRLAPPILGVALLSPLLGGVAQSGDRFNEYQVVAGVVLLLAGVTALLPWLVEVVVGRLGRGGGLPWQLATRRLQLESGTAARVVNGIAVAVAGAIGLQMLFAGVQHAYRQETGQHTGTAQMFVDMEGRGDDRPERIAAALRAEPAVASLVMLREAPLEAPGGSYSGSLVVAGCDTLRAYAVLDRCRRGDAFAVRKSGAGGAPLRAGRAVDVTGRRWTVPAGIRAAAAREDAPGWLRTGILATPGVVPAAVLERTQAVTYVGIDQRQRDAIERVRNAAAAVDPLVAVQTLALEREDSNFVAIRRALLAGAVAVLALIGASLLVGVIEQLRERRRLLAALVAVGARRSTLSWSVLLQAAIPVTLGLGLAIAAGVGLGAVLLAIVSEPVRVDPASIAAMAGAGAAVVLLVTALSLPALWRLMRPDGLRTE